MSTENNEIPESDLVEGQVYEINSRNLIVGAWRPETRGFVGLREKFKSRYLFEEYHWDCGPPHGTARAVTALEGFRFPKDVIRAYDPMRKNKRILSTLDALDKLMNRIWVVENTLTEEWGVRTWDMTEPGTHSNWPPTARFLPVANETAAWRMVDVLQRMESDGRRVGAVVVRRQASRWEIVKERSSD